MKMFIQNILTVIREKKQYFFLAIPFLLILLAIVSYIAIFQTSDKKTTITPTQIPTSIPTIVPDTPTEEPTADPTTKAILQKQAAGDETFAKEQAAIQQKYPWINNLPIDNKRSFIYFDADSASFVGLLYPTRSSSVSIDDQVAGMKSEAQNELLNLNINYQSYPFEWKVTPEP